MKLDKARFKKQMSKEYVKEDFFDYSIYKYFDLNHGNKRVLEVGFGYGHEVVYYVSKGYNVLAVDSDENCEINLLDNIRNLDLCDESKIEFRSGNVFDVDFSDELFSVILANNLIHFFSKSECTRFFQLVDKLLEINGIIYILCHHKNHSDNSEGQTYFKQFFDKEILSSYIDIERYEILRYEYIENIHSVAVNEQFKKAGSEQNLNLKPFPKEYQIRLVLEKKKNADNKE